MIWRRYQVHDYPGIYRASLLHLMRKQKFGIKNLKMKITRLFLFRFTTVALVAGMLLLSAGTSVAQPAPKADRFDNGKMWTFDHPPIEYFSETYGFEPDQSWFDRARLGTLRIPGCTASFVSSHGLVLTNHHCGRNAVTQVSGTDEALLDNGFYATSINDERKVPGFYADQLVAIEDVTNQVHAASEMGETEAERANARDEMITVISDSLKMVAGGDDPGMVVEIIPLYHGGRYAAYTFKRYSDVRLVMAPELKLGYFGGDADNFTFPRYALDMTFFRVYNEAGEPLETENFFLWSMEGTRPGDAVFVVGNPGSTSRLETVAQLEVRRDMTDKNLLAFIKSRIEALKAYQASVPTVEEKNSVRNMLFSLLNAEKAYEGQLKALNDEVIMARRQDAEDQFKRALKDDATLAAKYGNEIEEMAAIQQEIKLLAASHGAFFALTSQAYSSDVLRRSLLAYQYLKQEEAGVTEEALSGLLEQIATIQDQPEGLAARLLEARLQDIADYFGEDSELVSTLMAGKSAEAMADNIVESSMLSSAATAADALKSGALPASDPGLKLAAAITDAYQAFQSAFAGLSAKQAERASQIGRARFEVYGTDVPPDATFSLRIADGVVAGYSYNGTYASPYTSFYGLYDHYYSYGPESEWTLPDRWLNPPATFNKAVPFNFASTNDIIGGNSGSPVLNTELELVGLIFDGNIESLSGNYIYLPDVARSVSVDARGILEVLDEIYDADRMVLELTDDVLVATEEEADARSSSLGQN